jgi:hypothetical protein
MPSRIAAIAIDAVEPRVVANFWCQTKGSDQRARWEEGIGRE